MISLDQRKSIMGCVSLLRVRGVKVEHRIEIDELTLSAVLILQIKGEIADAQALVDEARTSLEQGLGDEVVNIQATRSKGRGRPQKTGAPPAEGLTIRCVLK